MSHDETLRRLARELDPGDVAGVTALQLARERLGVGYWFPPHVARFYKCRKGHDARPRTVHVDSIDAPGDSRGTVFFYTYVPRAMGRLMPDMDTPNGPRFDWIYPGAAELSRSAPTFLSRDWRRLRQRGAQRFFSDRARRDRGLEPIPQYPTFPARNRDGSSSRPGVWRTDPITGAVERIA